MSSTEPKGSGRRCLPKTPAYTKVSIVDIYTLLIKVFFISILIELGQGA